MKTYQLSSAKKLMMQVLHGLECQGQTAQIAVLIELINQLVKEGYDAASKDIDL
jgi:hypothetical protein